MNLYNTERPVIFDEMIGQETTIKSIKLGLKRGMFEHASIFYGQTGGGKTTAARITGSYLNCENPSEDGEPCCKCAACRSLREDNYMDYFELNAAKDGGKSDINNLISEVRYMPSQGKVKVYTIDEAHCLTTDAWKSLLKILEEPPAHVYFILCTTAFNAIPKEIANRCGKYEFKSISSDTLFKYLCDMRTKLGHVNYTDEALRLIANSSKGSARDAVNTYSHVRMPFSNDEDITAEDVKTYLSLVGPEKLSEFIIACSMGVIKDAVNVLTEEEKSAVEATTFLKSTCNMVSDAITVASGGRMADANSEEYVAYINDIMRYADIERLISVASMLNESYSNTAERSYAALRLAVGRVCVAVKKVDSNNDVQITGYVKHVGADSELLKRFERMEQLVKQLTDGSTMVAQSTKVIDQEMVKSTEGSEYVSQQSDVMNLDNTVDETVLEDTNNTNPLFALFGASSPTSDDIGIDSSEDVEAEDQLVKEITDTENSVSNEDLYYVSLASEYDEPDDLDYAKLEENSFKNESNSEVVAGEQKEENCDSVNSSEEQKNNGESSDGVCCTIDNGVGGISFSNSLLAAAFKSSNTQGSKAEQALFEACKVNNILNILVSTNCQKQVTDTQVVLATPFQPVKDAIDALLLYEKVTNVNAVTCEGIGI